MFRNFKDWFSAIGQWIQDSDFQYGDDIMFFCLMFLIIGIVIAGIITLAWYTFFGRVAIIVLFIMLRIFVAYKYRHPHSKDTDCG